MPAQSVEVAIVGGGVIGSAIAYHLALQKRRVIVLERAAPAEAPAASWASAGGVRRQGRHAAECALASEAIPRWPSLSEELGADTGYRPGGNLYLAEGERATERMRAFVALQRRNGFSDVQLLDRAECLAIVPGLNDQVRAGSFSPIDGQANPPLTTRAFAQAAERLGARYRNGVEAARLLCEGERVVGVLTSEGELRADQVVLAAGCWSDTLALEAGFRLPVRTSVLQILISTPDAPGALLPVLGSQDRKLSLKQLPDGAFMLGGGWPGDAIADRRGFQMREASVIGSWATASELLPAVGQQRIANRWCGLEAQSIDGIPFIGAVPSLDGLFVATGFSGHGFAIAPAVGRALAEQLAGRPAPTLAGLSPARIAGMSEEAIERFLSADDEEGLAAG